MFSVFSLSQDCSEGVLDVGGVGVGVGLLAGFLQTDPHRAVAQHFCSPRQLASVVHVVLHSEACGSVVGQTPALGAERGVIQNFSFATSQRKVFCIVCIARLFCLRSSFGCKKINSVAQ